LRRQHRALELPSGEVRHADVPNFAGPDQRIEGGKRLLDRRRGVPLMRLVQIDVVGFQAPETPLASANDPASGKALGVAGVIHPAAALGRQDDGVAPAGLAVEPPPDDLLGRAARANRWVHIGGVDQVAAAFHIVIQHRARS